MVSFPKNFTLLVFLLVGVSLLGFFFVGQIESSGFVARSSLSSIWAPVPVDNTISLSGGAPDYQLCGCPSFPGYTLAYEDCPEKAYTCSLTVGCHYHGDDDWGLTGSAACISTATVPDNQAGVCGCPAGPADTIVKDCRSTGEFQCSKEYCTIEYQVATVDGGTKTVQKYKKCGWFSQNP